MQQRKEDPVTCVRRLFYPQCQPVIAVTDCSWPETGARYAVRDIKRGSVFSSRFVPGPTCPSDSGRGVAMAVCQQVKRPVSRETLPHPVIPAKKPAKVCVTVGPWVTITHTTVVLWQARRRSAAAQSIGRNAATPGRRIAHPLRRSTESDTASLTPVVRIHLCPSICAARNTFTGRQRGSRLSLPEGSGTSGGSNGAGGGCTPPSTVKDHFRGRSTLDSLAPMAPAIAPE
jgi:hypothetical protein